MEDRLKIPNTALKEKVMGNMKKQLKDMNNRVRRSNISRTECPEGDHIATKRKALFEKIMNG